MRKFILNLCTFILFTSLFYTVVLFFWEQCLPLKFKPNIKFRMGSYGHMYSRLSEVKNKKDIDILFLGSSHAYRGFDTRIFSNAGLETFNLGSSAQTPFQTNVLLDRYLEKMNPKTVIYEVYPNAFMLDGVESSLDIIANDRNDISSLKMALKINNIKVYNTLLYASTRDLLNLNDSFSELVIKGQDIYIPGGFVEKKIAYSKPNFYRTRDISLNQFQFEAFLKIVTRLKDLDINLILVYAPIQKTNYNSFTNTALFDSMMKSYSEYYNFNEILDLDDSLYFYDSNHLNQAGVEFFNTKLIEILDIDTL